MTKVDDAISVLYRDYYGDVNQYADDFIERIQAGEWDDRDDFMDSMHEEIDGAARVIYTAQAQRGLLVSENADAGIDSLGPEGFDWSSGIPYSALMYFAFEQDIYEAMERKDFDINDDEIFEQDDEDEEDDD